MSDPDQESATTDPTLGGAPELATKIAAVMADIDDVPKNGRNDYHGYDYATDDDVMGAVRPVMAEHNLVALPSVVSRDIQRFGNEQDGYTLHTRIVLDLTLIDGDSGQQRTIRWEGEAQDTQDKGLYKAYTSAIKYAMLKIFLLSADTDVETDDIAGKQGAQQAPQGRPKKNGSPEQPTDRQISFASDLAQSSVWSEKEQQAIQKRIENGTRSQVSNLIDDMQATIEERESASGPAQTDSSASQDPSQGQPTQSDPDAQEDFPDTDDPNADLPF